MNCGLNLAKHVINALIDITKIVIVRISKLDDTKNPHMGRHLFSQDNVGRVEQIFVLILALPKFPQICGCLFGLEGTP